MESENENINLQENSKKKYKIVYDREGCIGVAACAAEFPERWQMSQDGKADLIGSEKVNENESEFILEIGEEELEAMKRAAQSCPVNVIHIIDLETGEKII